MRRENRMKISLPFSYQNLEFDEALQSSNQLGYTSMHCMYMYIHGRAGWLKFKWNNLFVSFPLN